jgi:hypothetical protein
MKISGADFPGIPRISESTPCTLTSKRSEGFIVSMIMAQLLLDEMTAVFLQTIFLLREIMNQYLLPLFSLTPPSGFSMSCLNSSLEAESFE